MTKTIVISYLVVAFVLSIVGTYCIYRIDYSYEGIDQYFDRDFSLIGCMAMWLFWPITLIVLFFNVVLPSFYMCTVIILDKIFGGEK